MRYRSDTIYNTSGCIRKTATAWKLITVCLPKCTMEKKSDSRRNLFPVHSRASKGERAREGLTIFPFSRSNQRSGCLRHSTFGFHILSAMPARSPGARLSVILRTRLSAHSFIRLRPFARRFAEMFPSFSLACFPLPSFLRRFSTAFLFNRYYAIPVLDREN